MSDLHQFRQGGRGPKPVLTVCKKKNTEKRTDLASLIGSLRIVRAATGQRQTLAPCALAYARREPQQSPPNAGVRHRPHTDDAHRPTDLLGRRRDIDESAETPTARVCPTAMGHKRDKRKQRAADSSRGGSGKSPGGGIRKDPPTRNRGESVETPGPRGLQAPVTTQQDPYGDLLLLRHALDAFVAGLVDRPQL